MLRSLPTGEERRDLTLTDAGVSVLPDSSGAQRFVGHPAVFNTRTAIGNPMTVGFYEEIAPGSFTKTLGESDARFLIDHSSYHVVSRSSAGTLDLSQDVRGLSANSVLDTRLSYVNDLMANLENGNIRGMSFGFQVIKDDWALEPAQRSDGSNTEVEVRTIREVKLIEVSAVTFPAYEDTDAGLRYSLIPALRHRGDEDAIARAVAKRPELGPLLGYDPELAPTHIYIDGKRFAPGESVSATLKDSVDFDLGDRPVRTEADAQVVADALLAAVRAGDPKKPYGDVAYADPGYQKDGKKRYPIDTEEHAKAAWSYINQAKNAAGYTAEQLASIKSKIMAALKKFGVDISDGEKKSSSEPGETTHQPDPTESSEPAASTRNMPSQHELAKAELRRRSSRLRTVA
jgi:HK97 family phage prohead protease